MLQARACARACRQTRVSPLSLSPPPAWLPQPTYGYKAADARRLGVEKWGSPMPAELNSMSLKLGANEVFHKVEYAVGR